MLTGALYYLQNELKGFIQILDMQTLLLVYVAVFALGIVLSVIATIFAVNKYLRMGSISCIIFNVRIIKS